jgi:polysaccharide export outer membrane protein
MKSRVSSIIVAFTLLLLSGCATQGKATGGENSVLRDVQETDTVVLKDFQLGAGDVIEISVWRNDDLYRKVQIGPSGLISYPLVGTIQVSGLSIIAIRDNITTALSEYIVDPQVGINVVSYESNKVFVLGEVRRPGVFQSVGQMSAVEAVSMAGGFTLDAAPRTVLLVRGDIDDPELISLNLSDALKKGDFRQDLALLPGDVLYVPATTFASTERFFKRIDSILKPIVRVQTGIILMPQVEDALKGETVRSSIVLSP